MFKAIVSLPQSIIFNQQIVQQQHRKQQQKHQKVPSWQGRWKSLSARDELHPKRPSLSRTPGSAPSPACGTPRSVMSPTPPRRRLRIKTDQRDDDGLSPWLTIELLGTITTHVSSTCTYIYVVRHFVALQRSTSIHLVRRNPPTCWLTPIAYSSRSGVSREAMILCT